MKKRPFARMEVTNELLTANVGLAVIGQLMRIAGIEHVHSNRNRHRDTVSDADILKAHCGLLSVGKVGFDHIRLFADDLYFMDALGIDHMPKEATLRLRFESMSQDLRTHEDVFGCSIRLLGKTNVLPEPIAISGFSWVRVDTDTSIFDNSNSKKEGVEVGYTKVAGYAPVCSFLEGGFVVGAQLCPGAQNVLHEGHENYFSTVRDHVRTLFPDNAVLWVADAAFDDITHMSSRHADGDCFIIKRNPRRAAKKPLIALAKEEGSAKRPRPGKTVYTGETLRKRGDMSSLRLIYEVTERTSKKGKQLLIPEYTIFSIWTNLPPEIETNAVLQLYRDRGTCEQYFAEIKSELALERLPSGKFAVNALYFQLGMFVNNMLRVIGRGILSNNVGGLRQATRRRLRTVMQNLMYLCGRIVRHARSIVVKVKSNRGFGEALCEMYRRYSII